MLRFGTAGLRGPLGPGPDAMNETTVTQATAGLAKWLQNRCLGGGRVVVGRDARHGSEEFAIATAEVMAAAGFEVALLPAPLPTPVTSFAVRELGAVAGVQITASHNPPTDNGYKVFVSGGAQLAPPADREIEDCIQAVTEPIPRIPVTPTNDRILTRYIAEILTLPQLIGGNAPRADIRIVLTPLHGVGGLAATHALTATGFTDLHLVPEQAEPDPDFPTVEFPNPEEPGATDMLLDTARRLSADLALALDPDADRLAVGIPTPDGWRMLRGDETGILLADDILRGAPPNSLVATTIVSSQLLSRLAPTRGSRYVETLTGFKWLARAGEGLVYAYEEALGHCVDPRKVPDKDGVSAAVAVADLVSRLRASGRTLTHQLDDLAVEFGVYLGEQVSVRTSDPHGALAIVERLRGNPPTHCGEHPVFCRDLTTERGSLHSNTLIFTGENLRVVIRPSGTEPKLKCYLEVVEPVPDRSELSAARQAAAARLHTVRNDCANLLSNLTVL